MYCHTERKTKEKGKEARKEEREGGREGGREKEEILLKIKFSTKKKN